MQTNAISPLIQQYTVDFAGNNNFLFVKGIQGDGYGTRYVDISLMNNGQPYTVNNDAVTVVIRGTKPDNNAIFNKCEILDANTIRVEITQQMSAVAGKSNYEISIMSNTENRTLTSFPFFIIISKSSFDIGYVVSSDEFGLLVEKINQVHLIQTDLSDLKSDMQDSIKNCDDATSDCIDTTNDARKAIGDMNTLHNSVTTAEATRMANENARISEENNRKSAEQTRISNENTRKSNETTRINNENSRKTEETVRVNAENARESAENARNTAENARNTNENNRITNENDRITNENDRENEETMRISSETARNNEEIIRKNNENNRIANETIRQTNENTRQTDTTTAINRANVAAKACEDIIAGTGIVMQTEKGSSDGVAKLDSNAKIITNQLPEATNIGLGAVKIGNNITLSNGIISVIKKNIIDALGFTPINKSGDTMTGMLDIDIGNGLVKIFGDDRGAHVWLNDVGENKNRQLQIVCENTSGMFYLVDTTTDQEPVCKNWVQLSDTGLETQRNISVGNGAENGRVHFISPSNLRNSWIGMANDNGNMYWWDTTANKAIISAPKGGTPSFHGHATSDLALTGGNMTGNLAMGNTSMSDGPEIHWIDKFRQVWAGMCNGAGDWYLYDATNSKAIIHSTKAGVNIFKGNAESATNADTVDGKHASELQNYNNLTNKPVIPNSVAVKGNKEGAYRQGNVNLTPANIGAVNTAGDIITGVITLNNGTENTPSIRWVSTKRTVWAGQANSTGAWYLWDATDSKPIIAKEADNSVNIGGSRLDVQCPIWVNEIRNRSVTDTMNILGTGYLNLRCDRNIQCRNWSDNAWMGISASGFHNASSVRYKENINPMSDERAKKLLGVEVCTYDYKDNIVCDNQYDRTGVIAEEVAEIMPEVVSYREIDNLGIVPDSVDYSRFVPSLIKMVQIQQNEIENQQKKIADLERRLEALENMASAIPS